MVDAAEEPLDLTFKLTLAGDYRVGKSSLVRRFVSNTFSDDYITTLGAKVASRRFTIADPHRPDHVIRVGATIWDVMGNVGFREMLKDAYFFNSRGVLLVGDVTRPETFHSLLSWHETVWTVAGEVPVVILANKSDLKAEAKVSPADMDALCAPRGWAWLPTSAKTGENVERAFGLLTDLHVRAMRAGQLPVVRPE